MYELTLIEGTLNYDFIKFTISLCNLYQTKTDFAFAEGGPLLVSLQEVFDSNDGDSDLVLEMNVAGLSYISKLVDYISKVKLEQEPLCELLARQTEKETGLDVWAHYYELAEQYFVDIKKMINKKDWKTIEQSLVDIY